MSLLVLLFYSYRPLTFTQDVRDQCLKQFLCVGMHLRVHLRFAQRFIAHTPLGFLAGLCCKGVIDPYVSTDGWFRLRIHMSWFQADNGRVVHRTPCIVSGGLFDRCAVAAAATEAHSCHAYARACVKNTLKSPQRLEMSFSVHPFVFGACVCFMSLSSLQDVFVTSASRTLQLLLMCARTSYIVASETKPLLGSPFFLVCVHVFLGVGVCMHVCVCVCIARVCVCVCLCVCVRVCIICGNIGVDDTLAT